MHPAAFSVLLHRALEARLGRLLELAAVTGWQADTTSLHDVRVASRRVRAVLELVDPAIYPGFKRHLRRLKALTRSLSATREWDVHLDILDSMKTENLEAVHEAALEHTQEILGRHQRQARKRMERTLSKLSIADCAGLLRVPSLPHPFAPGDVRDCARNCLEPRLQSVLERLSNLGPEENVAALHELRIRVKKGRYTLEILAPGLESETGRPLERLRELQTILGEHHDLATLEARLWELHGQLTGRYRAILATGLLDILGLVAEGRRLRFDRFCQITPNFTLDFFVATLRPAAPDPGRDA
jgi:CHAD domain-containing protein